MEALKTVALGLGIFSCIMGGIGMITAKDDISRINNHLACLGGLIVITNTLPSGKCISS
jgi:hypothetical protein